MSKLNYCPKCGGELLSSRTFFLFYGAGQCVACDDCEIAWSIGIDEEETKKMYDPDPELLETKTK